LHVVLALLGSSAKPWGREWSCWSRAEALTQGYCSVSSVEDTQRTAYGSLALSKAWPEPGSEPCPVGAQPEPVPPGDSGAQAQLYG